MPSLSELNGDELQATTAAQPISTTYELIGRVLKCAGAPARQIHKWAWLSLITEGGYLTIT